MAAPKPGLTLKWSMYTPIIPREKEASAANGIRALPGHLGAALRQEAAVSVEPS